MIPDLGVGANKGYEMPVVIDRLMKEILDDRGALKVLLEDDL